MRCWTSPASFDDEVSALLGQQALDPLAFKNWRIDLGCLAELFFGVSEGRDVALGLETTVLDGALILLFGLLLLSTSFATRSVLVG